jgi:hypothetical protein
VCICTTVIAPQVEVVAGSPSVPEARLGELSVYERS